MTGIAGCDGVWRGLLGVCDSLAGLNSTTKHSIRLEFGIARGGAHGPTTVLQVHDQGGGEGRVDNQQDIIDLLKKKTYEYRMCGRVRGGEARY